MEVTIDCVLCGAEHEYEIDPGERPTRWYPGSAPSAHHLSGECSCAKTCGNEIGYWMDMQRYALAEADDEAYSESPFDTMEEWMGER